MSNRLLVLVVDDDKDTRDSFAAVLRVQGHEASVAADGHVVLLDVGLPGMDGYEVGRAIREAWPCKPPFVVAVSGWPEDPTRRDGSGIDLYLTKPLEPGDLCRMLGRFGRVVDEPPSVPQDPLTVRRP
jgi:CheY-like chemotaxis protein